MRVDLEESPEVLRYLQSLDARRAAIVWSQLFVVRETPFLIQQLFLMRFPEAQLPDCFGNPSPAVVVARGSYSSKG